METMTVSKVAVAIMCMVAVLSLSAPHAVEGLACDQVFSALVPCLQYMTYGGDVSDECCLDVKTLFDADTTPQLRKETCGCVQELLSAFTGIESDLAAGLPGECGVEVPYTFGADCSRVQWVQIS